MAARTIRFDDGEVRATLTIRKASYQDDIDRQALIDEALDAARRDTAPDRLGALYRRNAQVFVYPSLLCATHAEQFEVLDGSQWKALPWPLPFDGVLRLPAELLDAWTGAVYDLNPRWDPARRDEQDAVEKKAPISTGG
jgi:hypothetical protein